MKDIAETIADNLLADHVALMAENHRLREINAELLSALEKVATCSRYTADQPLDLVFALDTLRAIAVDAIAAANGV